MDFGKLSDISTVDFSVPELSRASRQRLESLGAGLSPTFRLWNGCPVWNQRAWLGRVYARGTDPSDFLFQYARQFSAVELNTTYYRVPDPATVRNWTSKVPPGFVFCPKVTQEISHQKLEEGDVSGAAERMMSFCRAVYGFGDYLGVTFLQLSPTYASLRLPELSRFLAQVPREIRLAVEFRHPSWFEAGDLRSEAREAFERHGVGTVITDVAGRRDVAHAGLTESFVLIRFVGNGLHPSDFERAEQWVERLARWREAGLRDVYFFNHQPDEVYNPELLAYFIERMNQKLGLGLSKYEPRSEGEQMRLI